MKIVFHFPPESWGLVIFLWIISLVFVKWFYDFYKNRKKGVTVTKAIWTGNMPFAVFSGKISKSAVEKKLGKPIPSIAYIDGIKLYTWLVVFAISWLIVFLMGFVEIFDNR